jgi:hypothetical protein
MLRTTGTPIDPEEARRVWREFVAGVSCQEYDEDDDPDEDEDDEDDGGEDEDDEGDGGNPPGWSD